MIKTGGEWISSIDLEYGAMGHPGVEMAAEHAGRAGFLRRLSTAEVRVTVLETEVELDLLGDDSMSEPPSTLLEAAFELLDPESLVLYDPETDEWPRKRAT